MKKIRQTQNFLLIYMHTQLNMRVPKKFKEILLLWKDILYKKVHFCVKRAFCPQTSLCTIIHFVLRLCFAPIVYFTIKVYYDQSDIPAARCIITFTNQLDISTKRTSLTEQFYIFKTLASLFIDLSFYQDTLLSIKLSACEENTSPNLCFPD